MKFLSGYKTYIVAIGGAITAIGAFLNGTITVTELIAALWAVIGLFTTRQAIATTQVIAGGSLPTATPAQKAEAKEAAPAAPKPTDER